MDARRTVVAVVAALALGALAGCTSPDPEPPATTTAPATTPAPTPTVEPEQTAEQKNVQDATAALTEFTDAANAAEQAGYADWSPLSEYLSGDFRPAIIQDFADYSAAGVRRTGDIVLVSSEVAEYLPGVEGGGGEAVVLAACLDVSQTDVVDASGTSILSSEGPDRYVVSYRMVHEDDGRWTVNTSTPETDRTC